MDCPCKNNIHFISSKQLTASLKCVNLAAAQGLYCCQIHALLPPAATNTHIRRHRCLCKTGLDLIQSNRTPQNSHYGGKATELQSLPKLTLFSTSSVKRRTIDGEGGKTKKLVLAIEATKDPLFFVSNTSKTGCGRGTRRRGKREEWEKSSRIDWVTKWRGRL